MNNIKYKTYCTFVQQWDTLGVIHGQALGRIIPRGSKISINVGVYLAGNMKLAQ